MSHLPYWLRRSMQAASNMLRTATSFSKNFVKYCAVLVKVNMTLHRNTNAKPYAGIC